MRFALWFDMTLLSPRVRQLADRVGRMVPRLAAVIIGFIGMVVGVGMMVTIVMLPAGVVVALLGVVWPTAFAQEALRRLGARWSKASRAVLIDDQQ
jgi:threonine/homoserine efflux transporter RhtA